MTRNAKLSAPAIRYVLNNERTRSASAPDTLAYVINYPDNGGFVIVSSVNKVYPVLAYSDKGNFTFDNEIAKENFIDKIGVYISNADNSKSYEVSSNDFLRCYSKEPFIHVELTQRKPWSKVVEKEHPGCPVGCVALATAVALSYSMSHIAYHGSVYNFKSILLPIRKAQNPNTTYIINPNDEWERIEQPKYTYYQALDSMATLLSWIGKDVDMEYKTNESAAYWLNAYDLCCKLRKNNLTDHKAFDMDEICFLLKDNHIIFLASKSHTWISDGYSFCVSPTDSNKTLDSYIHCYWGWGGGDDGFYSGSVFSTSSGDFYPANYFALRRGNYSNTK